MLEYMTKKYINIIWEKDLDIDTFVKNLDRNRYHRQLHHYWDKFLNIPKDSEILDLGCGWGDILLFLKNKGFTNCYGIDSSPQHVEIAKS